METARGGEASSSDAAAGGGMKRSPTWLEVSNLKLAADIKRRDDFETAIEWDYLTSPSLECGLTHLDLEHLREVAVRKGCGDDEIRRFAWPLVLGIGLEPGERGDPDEYVDRAAFAEAARALLDGGGKGNSTDGGGENSDDSAMSPPGRQPNDAATIEADVQRSLWAFTEGWSESRRRTLRDSLRRVIAGSVHAHHRANPGCVNYLQGFHSIAGVMLVVLKDEGLAAAAMERLALYHLRDSTRSSPVNLLDAMELVSPLLRRADPTLHDAVFRKHNVPTHFSIEWLMTWHIHSDLDVSNRPEGVPGYDSHGPVGGARRNAARLARATRLIDAFLLSHPLFSVYVGVAEMCRIKDGLMAVEHDWEMFQRLKKLRIATDEARELELEQAVVMEGMDGGRVGETTPGSEKKKKKKAWWRRRPKMKKKGVAVSSGGAPGGSGGESDVSLKNRAGAIEPASSVSSPLGAAKPPKSPSPPLPPRHVRTVSVESNVSRGSDLTGGYTTDEDRDGDRTPDLGFSPHAFDRPSSVAETIGEAEGPDAMHDGDWVELARLDDLLRSAQDLFDAHPPTCLYEDVGLIPPSGSACTMYPYPWWFHGFHLEAVAPAAMNALDEKEKKRDKDAKRDGQTRSGGRVRVDRSWRDELAHERRGDMARSPLPADIARGPPPMTDDSIAIRSAMSAAAPRHRRVYAGDRRWDKAPPGLPERIRNFIAEGSSTRVAAAVVFLAVVCDLYSTLYVSDTCGTSLAAAAPINGGVCVARAYETMRTYVFFARCYHWTAWFLDLFTDPIFGQLYAFVLRVAAARVAWASELVPVPGGARRVVQALTSGAHALGPRPVAL